MCQGCMGLGCSGLGCGVLQDVTRIILTLATYNRL